MAAVRIHTHRQNKTNYNIFAINPDRDYATHYHHITLPVQKISLCCTVATQTMGVCLSCYIPRFNPDHQLAPPPLHSCSHPAVDVASEGAKSGKEQGSTKEKPAGIKYLHLIPATSQKSNPLVTI